MHPCEHVYTCGRFSNTAAQPHAHVHPFTATRMLVYKCTQTHLHRPLTCHITYYIKNYTQQCKHDTQHTIKWHVCTPMCIQTNACTYTARQLEAHGCASGEYASGKPHHLRVVHAGAIYCGCMHIVSAIQYCNLKVVRQQRTHVHCQWDVHVASTYTARTLAAQAIWQQRTQPLAPETQQGWRPQHCTGTHRYHWQSGTAD